MEGVRGANSGDGKADIDRNDTTQDVGYRQNRENSNKVSQWESLSSGQVAVGTAVAAVVAFTVVALDPVPEPEVGRY